MSERYPLRGDDLIDEILIVCEQGVVSFRTTPWWKKASSGMSWRTRCNWAVCDGLAKLVISETREKHGRHVFDESFGTVLAGCAALYPGLWSSEPLLREVLVSRVYYIRKGRVIYEPPGTPVPLLTIAGHITWGLLLARDYGLNAGARADREHLCDQPGCRAEATTRLTLRKLWCESTGAELEMDSPRFFITCDEHAVRGDCRLNDCEANLIASKLTGDDMEADTMAGGA